MGANFLQMTLDDMSEEELKTKFRAYQEECAYDTGHGGYSGGWQEADGLKIVTDKRLDELIDTAEKWGPALALKYEGKWHIAACCSS